MYEHGEVDDFDVRGMARVLRYIVTHRMVLVGIAANALSFGGLLALLSVASLSFAVPATAMQYIVKTFAAKWYLGEHINGERWAGVGLVAAGIVLIAF
jgi:drug/metabolite transporter (DMT)-like permease